MQDRGDADDPPLPPELERGTPGSVLDPVAVHPVEVLPDTGAAPAEQVAEVASHLQAEARQAHPEYHARDNEPAPDPSLQWMRDWRPERGGEHAP